jgi:predicted metal-dependent hydrolase
MESVNIFGENFEVAQRKSSDNRVKLLDNKIIVEKDEKASSTIIKEFLSELLYSTAFDIFDHVKNKDEVDIFGDLDFEIQEKIDNKKERVAKIKGRKILLKLNAVSLPKEALKYIIVHELAHVLTKRHTRRFWKTVEAMYPNFEEGKKLFEKYGYEIVN